MCKFWSPFWVQLSIVLCLQSTEQKSCPSLSKNCWLMRLPPHPLQLKQWGQACQWKSPCESPGESAVMVLLHVLQDLENMKKNHKNEVYCILNMQALSSMVVKQRSVTISSKKKYHKRI